MPLCTPAYLSLFLLLFLTVCLSLSFIPAVVCLSLPPCLCPCYSLPKSTSVSSDLSVSFPLSQPTSLTCYSCPSLPLCLCPWYSCPSVPLCLCYSCPSLPLCLCPSYSCPSLPLWPVIVAPAYLSVSVPVIVAPACLCLCPCYSCPSLPFCLCFCPCVAPAYLSVPVIVTPSYLSVSDLL